ncbi:MAG: methyltransferase domain-containing protein [Actinomycetota bacterium]|nr:methyltransferase domain-containing protein [Actinomycetota bacterium]
MPTDNAAAWDRHAASYQALARLPTDVAHYGPDVGTEADFRLLGDVRGKRVLELGCGGAQCSVAFAKQGATAIGIDSSAEMLAYAKRLCEQEEVKVELRQADMADLAFLRAESIDVAFSAYAFSYVEDLDRVFRQVNRVLKAAAPLVFSLPHPASALIDECAEPPLVVRRSYFDRAGVERERNGVIFTEYHHTISDLFGGLTRAGYRVDTILEPEPLAGTGSSQDLSEASRYVPRTVVFRARKEGG